MSSIANEQSPTKWQQRSTKFREQLSFISTTPSKKAILKSHWSPSTTAHSATSSPTFTTTSPPPPLPERMPEHPNPTLPEPIKVTSSNRSGDTVDLERNRDAVVEREAGPSTRLSRFAQFSFWKGGNNNSNGKRSSDSASLPPETPASTASSFVPNRLATWRPLNILRPSRPPILLPTSNITSATNNNTTTYHETKPVHIHTHVNAPSARREKRREKKNSGRCWLIILIIVLLYLVGNNIFLNIRVQSLTPSNSPNSGSSGVSDPPQAVKDCLSQFKLNAPSDPSSYPCGTCAPILQTIPNDLSPTAKKTDTAGQGTVLQFCALSDIVSATTNETLQNVGWMKNVDFCGSWSGIQCDTAGRVTVLTLVFPGVPATLAPSLSSLVGLQALSITGDGNIPAGPVAPSSANASSIFSLSALHNITLQSTALTGPLPDATFANSHNLTSVQLVNNAHLGQTLPSSLFTLPSLNALVVNGQSLTQSLTSAFSSASSGLKSSLTTLDLSSNSLPGSVPDFSEFTALVELSLGANQFTSLPSSDSGLPASLKTLNMAKNPDLSGNVPNVVCADSALTACDLRNTQLGINGQNATTGMCGHCLFGSA